MSDTNQAQLKELCAEIQQFQEAENLTQAALCRRYAGLGSEKTWAHLRQGNYEGYTIEDWVDDYRAVLELIRIDREKTKIDEPDYDNLPHVVASRDAVRALIQEDISNNRCVLIIGPTGSGKTTVARILARSYGRAVVRTEADETWKESISAMLGGLLRCKGVKSPPASAEARKMKLFEKLNASPVCLVIDEAHHLGLRTLNLIKSIINQCERTKIILLALDTLWTRLESNAYEEARQITGNRLARRIVFSNPDSASVLAFLNQRLSWENKADAKACAQTLAKECASYGGWNFVNLVCRQCRRISPKEPITATDFASAMAKAKETR